MKLAIGVLSGSLALVSEGIHSSLDFVATLATWMSVKTSDIPADREHPYGHGKIESLTAFAQSMLLLVTAFWITVEAYHHIVEPHADLYTGGGWYAAIGVVAVSLVVDITRARALSRAAKKFNSQALEADALHFGTELLSSAVVLAGLLIVKLSGGRYASADGYAAMAVAAVMIFTALRLGRRRRRADRPRARGRGGCGAIADQERGGGARRVAGAGPAERGGYVCRCHDHR